MAKFITQEWLTALYEKLNSDEHYAHVARNWEGDLLFYIEPDPSHPQEKIFHIDLYHGKCNRAIMLDAPYVGNAAYVFRSSYKNFTDVLRGFVDPMQAMLTRKLHVQGSMGYMMRNIPTVLDFVRCCKEITTSIG